jgi:ParB family chromosome partitioning protein
VLRKKVNGYEIISGERRFRACKFLKQDKIPAIVRPKVTDREMLEVSLVENIQRENLNDIEQAQAYQRLLLECGLSHEELSKRVGKSRSVITNALRLLKLPEPVQELVRTGKISMGHARALLGVTDPKRQRAMAKRIVEEKLSVREIESEVQEEKGESGAGRKRRSGARRKEAAAIDPDVRECLERIQYRFGTSVRMVQTKENRGKIEILFHNDSDLSRILELLAQ